MALNTRELFSLDVEGLQDGARKDRRVAGRQVEEAAVAGLASQGL